ncbi:MAG: type II toxin-antitoxin system MqsA family antitoxin [Chlorobium sp.]|nr:MAG: type II toxin-antitoxin system MqsA family antitoxin [Chlorobium sp.]
MNINRDIACCPLCGGEKEPGKTTLTVELGYGLVVIRDVPATVCVLCGADWVNDAVAAEVEKIVEEARKKQSQMEVISLKAS